jgi:nucleoside-diphosphate-sugar epimerase
VDVVFHCAALVSDWAPKRLFWEVNVGGTENLCKACLDEDVNRFVYVSTSDVFGLDDKDIIEETRAYRSIGEPYSDSKLAGTRLVWEYHRRGLPVTMAYPCWIYGRGDRVFLPSLADAIRTGQVLFWSKGALFWPTYVDNVSDLLMRMATHPRALGQGFLVHDGQSDTYEGLCAKIADALEMNASPRHIPYWSAWASAKASEFTYCLLRRKSRPLLTSYIVKILGAVTRYSIDKAKTDLEWLPPTPFEEGLRVTLDWLKNRYRSRRNRVTQTP